MSEIAEIMTSDVITVTPDTSIFDAIEILIANNITGLPVVGSDDQLFGIVTEKDLLHLISHSEMNPSAIVKDKTVKDIMTEDIASFDINDPLELLSSCLAGGKFRRVPILSDGKIVGVISRADLIAYILAQDKSEVVITSRKRFHRSNPSA